ncbi:8682_t:CDS:1, partial [Cetraspora pellucida]
MTYGSLRTSNSDNPWKYLYEDACWVLSHLYYVIVEFFIRNSILAFRFSFEKDDAPISEVNLSYLRNWISVLTQAILFIITLPITLFYPLLALRDTGVSRIR